MGSVEASGQHVNTKSADRKKPEDLDGDSGFFILWWSLGGDLRTAAVEFLPLLRACNY
jgi:hypothetical protein